MSDPGGDVRLTRRDLMKTGAFVGGAALVAGGVDMAFERVRTAAQNGDEGTTYELAKAENILYSACLNCTVACSIKAKIQDGVIAKIDGNPYSGMTMVPNLPMETSLQQAALVDGKLCPKGQAGIQTVYDPYRLRQVIKRAGPRGSGKWKTIPFDQAVDEIVNGGKLFAELGEDRVVPGLKDLYVLRDAKAAAAMSADVARLRKKQMTVAEFKAKHAAHLDTLIDPDHPDKGPKNNQLLFQCGRIHNGRVQFTQRFIKDAFGSVNWIEKTTLCGQTSNRAWRNSTMAYNAGAWSGGVDAPRPDHQNTEFLLVFGTVIFEANYGPVQQTEPITERLRSGQLKLAVADPRLTKVASKAWKWLPLKPGSDAALALAMARWILENERYDKRYLTNANMAAAKADGERALSDATWLVLIENGRATRHLTGADLAKDGKSADRVVISGGQPVPFDPNGTAQAVEGDLFVDTTLNGLRVKSALQLLKEEAFSRTMAESAEITGIPEADVAAVAKEFTSHGKKAAAEFYRGPIKHTNGWYNATSIIALNILVGNFDAIGGTTRNGGLHNWQGTAKGTPFPVAKMHPEKLGFFGIPITREGWQYEESTLFAGYPAKRPWYPFSGNIAQEIFPSMADGYPYPIKVGILAVTSPFYSIPGGQAQLRTVLDPEKLPLYIASDIVIGESSMYADYIFPDLTYLERFGITQGSHHTRIKSSAVRQPLITPLTETVKVNGEEMHISLEALMLAIADRLGLPGFGRDGFGPGQALTRPEDWYLKLHANLCWDGAGVPEANAEEMELFRQTHRHLAPTVYSEERWRKAVRPEDWPRLVYLLNRGGRFDSTESAYDAGVLKPRIGGINRLFIDAVAKTRHAMTGNHFLGHAAYIPIQDSMEKPVAMDEGDLHLITFKEVFGTQSRTISNYWSQAVAPENYVIISTQDARRLGLQDGEMVRVTSTSNPGGVQDLGNGKVRPVAGKLRSSEAIRPGVVAISTHFGHWAYGAADVVVNGILVPGDPRRAQGIHAQPLFRLDEHLRGTTLSEPIGGSASFYDTRVNLVKML